MFENPTPKQQAALGFNAERLMRIPVFLDSYLTQEKLSGYSVLVAREGKTVLHHHAGRSAFGSGFALGDDSIFRIYSMTKPITSLALMMLYEEGRILLHDPITKFISGFANVEVFKKGTAQKFTTEPLKRMITIHDLMTHQSGLTYDFHASHPVDAMYRNKKILGSRSHLLDLEEFTEQVISLPLACQPGAYWLYSVATDIIGRVIEVVSGQSLQDFLQERIFTPLGMSDTSFTIADDRLDRLTHNYWRDPLSKKLTLYDSPEKTSFDASRKFISGGGGLLSTLPDYFKFTEMMRLGGALNGTRLVAPNTLAKICTNQLPNNRTLDEHAMPAIEDEVSHYGTGFGLGVAVTTDPARSTTPESLGNFSWGGMASTYFWVDPIENLSAIFMTQLMPSRSYPIRPQLQQMVYAALERSG